MKNRFNFYYFIISIFVFSAVNVFAQTNSGKDENSSASSIKVCIVLAETGDTIKSIAEKYETPALTIAKLNGLFISSRLPKGREVKILYKGNQKPASCIEPKKETYKFVSAKPGDTVKSLACRYNVSPDQVAELNELSVDSHLAFAQRLKIPTEQNYECETTETAD